MIQVHGNTGIKNGMWKADKVKYGSLHDYIKYHLKPPTHCNNCKEIKKLEIANISGGYKRDFEDWKWLCRSCHMRSDGRIEKLIKFSKLKRLPDKICLMCRGIFHSNNRGKKFC